MMTFQKNCGMLHTEYGMRHPKCREYFKKEIKAMLFAKRYQEHSISIYSACEEYSQVSFAMDFGNGARSGFRLR